MAEMKRSSGDFMNDRRDIQANLTRQRHALRMRLDAIRRDFATGRSADAEDQAQERENDDALGEIQRETERELALVERSLSRLDQGLYGRCESCGEGIPAERLAALPYAIHCIHCAEGETHAC